MEKVQHKMSATRKKCNMKAVQQKKKCNMKKVQHRKRATRKKCYRAIHKVGMQGRGEGV